MFKGSKQSSADISTVLVGIVMLVFACLLLFYLIPHYVTEPAIVQNPMMSPSWLPRYMGWLIFLISILLIVQGLFRNDKGHKESAGSQQGPILRFLLMALALVVYLSFFELIGAIFSGALATLILFVAHPIQKKWVYSLAFIIPVVITLLFTKVLGVPLPEMPY
ncbi:tripartite tricarboxylate transporter TctB family protein [Marinomonas flavescens]|uniref:tripartite tricarboxylate transporter TctB family protein n=1 Tax=Marinomonas flavescens TaxID=2529379 RepID=UPI001055FE01|nr:tripartite tricarboxylate transporter TctB family protein [Marinomonas flavescens]